ncbi:hypothetical protein [Streptomyces sp. bgisy084]|uniref:hypothetical protein n=1 Tax=unclassified Streptomyces TaxID=2593676 RepID=UPI003D74D61F
MTSRRQSAAHALPGLGHRRILALPRPVTADAVRVTVQESRGTGRLLPVTLHRSRAAGG